MDSTIGATTRRSWDGPPGRRILGNSPSPHRIPRFLRRETPAPGHRTQEPVAPKSGPPGSRAGTTNRHAPLSRLGSAAHRGSRPRTGLPRCLRGNREPRQVTAASRYIRGRPTQPRSGSRTQSPPRHSSGNPAGRATHRHLGCRTATRARSRPHRPSRPCSPSGSADGQEPRDATIPPGRPHPRGRHPPTSGPRRISSTGATIRRCSDSRSAHSTSPPPSATGRRAPVARRRPSSAIRAPIGSVGRSRLRSGNPQVARCSTAPRRMAGISPATARKADSEDHHRTLRTGAAEESSCCPLAWRCCWWPVSWPGW